MDKAAIARDVALKLSDAEAAVDEAVAKTCRLIEGLMIARAEMRISTVVGAEAGDRLAAALSQLMAARSETAQAHAALKGVQDRIGLRRTDLSVDFVGPLDKPPPPSGLVEAERSAADLRVLRSA